MNLRPLPAIVLRRQAGVAAIVAIASYIVLYAAYWLCYETRAHLPPAYWTLFKATWPTVLIVKVAVFAAVGQLNWSRFVTFHDLVSLLRAATLSTLMVVLVNYLSVPELTTPRSIVLLDWGGMVLAIGGIRMLIRMFDERSMSVLRGADLTPVYIVGASVAGETLLRTISRHRELTYRVVGFIAVNPSQLHTRIGGVPVVGDLAKAIALAKRAGVGQLLLTSGELEGDQVRDLVRQGQQHDVAIRVLPRIDQLLDERVALQPREVSIEDLLRRDPVTLDIAAVKGWLNGKVVLVTGSAGSIGSEISRQLSKLEIAKLILADRSENGQFFLNHELRDGCVCDYEICMADITDGMRMSELFQTHQVDVVFHAAAYKHVPLMEANPGEAVKNIVLASRTLADLAHQHHVESFVMVSTDKAVNPTSVMGTCKRTAELYVQALAQHSNTRFVTVRFGNVLGSDGSVIPVFRRQIAAGGPLTVTHPDMTRFFMTIPEASQLVIQAGAMGGGGEIFVLDMGESVRIVDLARDLIRLSGLEEDRDIRIEFVGMRPGEKLFEELHIEGEQHLPTSHPKIMVAQADHSELAIMRAHIRNLDKLVNNRGDIRAMLGEIVPQYTAAKFTAPPGRKAA